MLLVAGCSGGATLGDGGGADGALPCASAEDCDDGEPCNGVEQCVDGACVLGTPLELDDGVECTVDRCDAGEVVHEPNDALCAHLEGAATCDEQRVVATVGRCEATGCVAIEEEEDCAAATDLPRCASTAGGADLTYLSSGGCVEGACVSIGTACEASDPVCMDGMRTTYTPSCDAAAGCGETASTEVCASPAARCLGPVHVTYTPSCADERDCGTAGETMESCPTPDAACVSNVYTVYAPTCDAATGCGSGVASETRCDDMEPVPTCAGRTTCTCSTVSEGCNCTFSPIAGCPVRAANGTCIDLDTLEVEQTDCVNHSTGFDCIRRTAEIECEFGCCPDSGGTSPFTYDRCCPDTGV